MTETTDTARAGSLMRLLTLLERGDLLPDLDDQLDRLTEAMRLHALDTDGKAKGAFSLKFELALEGGYLDVKCTPVAKMPTRKPRPSVLFLDSANRLTGEDPRQGKLEIAPPRSRV